jgi:CubicO group peptidase (beta-lactamase class C family)
MTKRWLPLAAALALGVLGGCAGHGKPAALPAPSAPYTETLGAPRWHDAAAAARTKLEDARQHHDLPSLSVAVAVEGDIVWAAVSGWADLESRTPASLNTRYRVGSTSKAVTATMLARLVDRGTMSLDAPASTWASDLPNREWPALTPRQLASHTAGIVDYDQNRDLAGLFHSIRERKQFDSVTEALSVFDGNKLKFTPGTGFRYTSFDIVLLSALMENAARAPFLELLDREVARPLGAASLSADHQDRPVPDRATFYFRKDGTIKPWARVNHSYKWAGGGLVASSTDLARIGSAWLDPAYIARETRETFWTPQRLASGEINEQSYAIGWRSNPNHRVLGEDRPIWNVHHGGVSKGAYSWLVIYPDYHLVVALNTNARLDDFGEFMTIEQAISRLFLGELIPMRAAADPR